MKAFGVFEGGGVRGYAHIGALKACEERGIEFVGVAGTSIGAIVATLVAAGYTASELYEIDADGQERGLFAGDPAKEFFEPRDYARLDRFTKWWRTSSDALARIRGPAAAIAQTRIGKAGARIWSLRRRLLHGSLEAAVGLAPAQYITVVPLALPHWRLLRTVWAHSGVLDGRRFADWLNERLCERLDLAPGTKVTFAQLPMPLSIIATNLSDGSMTVFAPDSHRDMTVADAAMASASYPLVFKPVRIEGEIFVDGGLVSNFPAWTLDGTRARYDRILPTFGFRVDDEPDKAGPKWPGDKHPQLIEVVSRIVSTAMAGRGDLEVRRIEDLHPMAVATAIKATDFHIILAARAGLYAKGLRCVRDYFLSQLGPRDPDEMERRLRRTFDIVRQVTGARDVVRAYMIQPVDGLYARVVYSALLDGDADDALNLRIGSASQVLCLDRREPVLMRVVDLDRLQIGTSTTKYIHALRPQSVRHAYCIPMFDARGEWTKTDPMKRAAPLAALCLDFSDADDRLLLDATAEDALAALADGFVDLWKERDHYELDPLEQDQPASGDWTPLPPAAGYYVSDRKVRGRPPQNIQGRIDKATL